MNRKITLLCMAAMMLYACRQGSGTSAPGRAQKNNDMTYPLKHISVSIDRPADEVYAFASKPENFPRWAPNFVRSIKRNGEDWIGSTAIGDVIIRFTPGNGFGILDHKVTLPSGDIVENPVRVLQNNEGAEVVFTLFRLPGRTDDEYREDAAMVTSDLNTLKLLLEQGADTTAASR